MVYNSEILSEIININTKLQEQIDVIKAGRHPDTFTIMYREGPGSFSLDYSDYFLDELKSRTGNSFDDEIDIRTSPVTWELSLERRLLSLGDRPSNYRNILKPDESNGEDNLKFYENVPNILRNVVTIVNYPNWGETVEFNYNKLDQRAFQTGT